jgi:pimeloyl-ACP methyl ester carboxylesterase
MGAQEPVRHIVFSHGQDGEPWGGKIVAMAEVARRHGLQVESIDYRGIGDPALRVTKLLEFCQALSHDVLLVGSSLGGHVATAVSTQVPTRGLFLLAPAFYMPGYEQFTPRPAACPVTIVHGWNDDIVPAANSVRFAGQYKSTLHLIDSDHRLTANIADVCEYLDAFLKKVAPRD